MTAGLGQTLSHSRIDVSTAPMRYVIQDAGRTVKLRLRATIATSSLSANRGMVEA